MTKSSPSQTASPCLSLREVSKIFGGLNAVTDLNLDIYPGERKGIIGPNGAGKTTLFNLITGVFPITTGSVKLFGQEVSKWPTYRRVRLGMARTFQITNLFPKLTVLDNVLLAAQGVSAMKFSMLRFQTSYRDLFDKCHLLLEKAGFTDRKDVEIHHLSHGEQRQIEIVLALATDPKLLLLDEPAAGLSTGESHEMADFLNTLDSELAILMIEHDMDVAFSVVNNIAVLHYGKIVEEGTTDEVRASEKVKEIYLGVG
ncbi:MAG: ABC transporter ATP-binding protein [SAR324 cluster bacterium]|nr:ABC transporter ATP-binding protein [SAR324 cluster bacterium]